MSDIDIPEWEIEEAIVRDPSILRLPESLGNLKLISRQLYLRSSGRFIDLFFSAGNARVIVELKKTEVDEPSVVIEQLLPYRRDVSIEHGIPEDRITCVLATPLPISTSIQQLCKENGIIWRQINPQRLIHALPPDWKHNEHEHAVAHIFRRRRPELSSIEFSSNAASESELASIDTFLNGRAHDDHALKEIAVALSAISSRAPLCAHEVGRQSYSRFSSDEQRWFWLFYSSLDRRANAQTFVLARDALARAEMYSPDAICLRVKDLGTERLAQNMRDVLTAAHFPLGWDSTKGNLAMPLAIIGAALWFSKYEFSAAVVRKHFESKIPDGRRRSADFMAELRDEIYGVGPRIAGQILRGFILKDGWNWPCNIPALLEKCDFNITFATHLRFGLIRDGAHYNEELGKFADQFLGGNYCILSHVLWFIRKRYCRRPKLCGECPMAGHCFHYHSTMQWRVPQQESLMLDLFWPDDDAG